MPSKTPFKPKSTFCPIIQNATLNTFAKKVNFDVENLFKGQIDSNQTQHNLSKTEQDAVESLSKNEQIVVKKADKGGAAGVTRGLMLMETDGVSSGMSRTCCIGWPRWVTDPV